MSEKKGEKRKLIYRGVIAGPLTKESVEAIAGITKTERNRALGSDLATSAVCRILKENDNADPTAVLELRNLDSKRDGALVRRVQCGNGKGHEELTGIAHLVYNNFWRLKEKISPKDDSRIVNALESLRGAITNETYRDTLFAIATIENYARSKGYSVLKDMEGKNGM